MRPLLVIDASNMREFLRAANHARMLYGVGNFDILVPDLAKARAGLVLRPSKDPKKLRWQKPSETDTVPSRPWVPHLPHLPKDTLKHFTKGGSLHPDRGALHAAIRAKFLDHVEPVPADTKPLAIVMMGGPASGKSSICGGIPHDKFVQCDADAVKEQLPEFREAVKGNARNAAGLAHEESSHLVKQIRDQAISERKNLLMDGTGKDADKYLGMIERLKAEGYHVHLMMPDLDKTSALTRATNRAEKKGRWVPHEFIHDAYDTIPHNFTRIAGAVDDWQLFDTRRNPPVKVWSKEGGTERVHDPEFVAKFREQYDPAEKKMAKGKKPDPEDTRTALTQFTPAELEAMFVHSVVAEREHEDALPKKHKRGQGITEVPSDAAFE